MDTDNNGLLEASQKGDGEAIKNLSKAVHDSRAMIESLFTKLELLHNELDTKAKELEKRLLNLTSQ